MNSSALLEPINADQWLHAVEHAWRASGQRITAPRQRLLRTIVQYQAPFSAEQLYADVQHESPAPGRATVYRALEQLAQAGWVVRLHGTVGDVGYYATWPGHIHHLLCTSCGTVVAFEGCAVDETMQHILRETGFAAHGHTLQIYGLCARCQAEATN